MDVANKIAKLVHLFEPFSNEDMLAWVSSLFEIFHKEWEKVDYWRASKFLSLARFCLNEIYIFLEGKHWNGKVSYIIFLSLISYSLLKNGTKCSSIASLEKNYVILYTTLNVKPQTPYFQNTLLTLL